MIEEVQPRLSVKGRETVLLIDDEHMVIEVGGEMLKRLGYHVLTADTGEKAVKLFEQHKDEIDLVVLDMIMPGMGGGEVFDRINAIQSDSKVLLSSGYSIKGQAEEIINRGCDGFIQKPFSLEQLAQKTREILDGTPAAVRQTARRAQG
jgi:CheY-like chemotaxis protein